MHTRRSCQVFRIGNLAEPQAGEARWSVQEIASTFTGQRLEGTGPSRPRPSSWAQFWSHSPPSPTVHRRTRLSFCPVQVQSRPVADGRAQSSKACEGATLPWVQIPPPPPLTCQNTGLCRRQSGASCTSGLICWSQLRAPRDPAARISRTCCAWATAESAGMPTPEALTDPQLVDEHGPVGVELVVADPSREQHQRARVVDRHPGCLADDLLVDVRPE